MFSNENGIDAPQRAPEFSLNRRIDRTGRSAPEALPSRCKRIGKFGPHFLDRLPNARIGFALNFSNTASASFGK